MTWTWVLTVASIVGVILNIKKRRSCFYIWAVTNASWAVVDFWNGLPAQGALFSVYFVLAIYGLYEWKYGAVPWRLVWAVVGPCVKNAATVVAVTLCMSTVILVIAHGIVAEVDRREIKYKTRRAYNAWLLERALNEHKTSAEIAERR